MHGASTAKDTMSGKPMWILRLHTSLYGQVLLGIAAGVLVGVLWPEFATSLQPLGDAFIKLVKMVIAPVVFLTIVTGIAGARDSGSVGRVGMRAMAYFLSVSSLALIVGLVVGNVLRPGDGLNIDPASLDAGAIQAFQEKAAATTVTGFLLEIIPASLLGALTGGSLLQVLLVALLVGLGLLRAGATAASVTTLLEQAGSVMFRIVALLMRLAPLGAFGAMAFTIGKYGIGALISLLTLIATFYGTSALFIIVVLGAIARWNGFSIFALIRYLRAELLLVLGTSSSEAALPALMDRLERAGCAKGVVGLVVPTGYSFNLDGTNIYMTLAALFIAQATGIELSLGEQLSLLMVAMISSKGAAGVTGAGFITLAATLSIVPSIPVAGMALILGIDRFMSECRALTNFVGNAVATIVVARWEGALDETALQAELALDPANMRTEESNS